MSTDRDLKPDQPVVLVIEHEERADLGWMEPLPGCQVDYVRPYRGEPLPTSLAAGPGRRGYQGLIVLGGSMAAWADTAHPWLPGARALLSEAVEAGTPTLGICLGAQLLALATGGEVGVAPQGPEVGVFSVTRTAEGRDDPLTAAWPDDTVMVCQAHYDTVHTLPPAATLLASSVTHRHQAFRIGSAWGVQYHPEVTPEAFARWMRDDAETLIAAGTGPEHAIATMNTHRAQLEVLARSHAEVLAGRVRGTGE